MAGVNKVIIVGHLGNDPELRFTSSGQPVCRLSVATSRQWKNKQTDEAVQETEWHRVTVWGNQAEMCDKFLSKGRQVYVEGRLRTSSYEKDGQKQYSTEIIAEQVQFLGSKNDGSGDSRSDDRGGSPDRPQQSKTGRAPAAAADLDPDDDIPF